MVGGIKMLPDRELFWNSGHLDKGYTGILTVNNEQVKYQNIGLGKHLR